MEHSYELEAVLARLRAFRRAAGLSYSGLALRSGLSRAALIGMDGETWGPTSATIRAIEAVIPHGWQAGDPVPAGEEPAASPEEEALPSAPGGSFPATPPEAA